MLYVKVDSKGNPTEVAKNYMEIRDEHLKKNVILPVESVFSSKSSELGYAEVPLGEAPQPQAGKRPVPDVPKKNKNGKMTRTWKYLEVTAQEKIDMDIVMRSRRKEVLREHIDTISPVRWNNMNDQDKAEVDTFYKAVLNMPEDPAWPFTTFPIRPNCLR